MKYNNRYFPFPVLGIRNDISGEFSCQLSVEVDKTETIITPRLKLDNADLNKLLDENRACFCMQLYCRATMYREVFRIKDPVVYKLRIPSSRLNGETVADFFICAEEDIDNYRNSGNSKAFGDFSFSIEKGDILAYGGQGIFYANKTLEELKSVSTIMAIRNSGIKNCPFFLDYDGPKIVINLSESDYDMYSQLKAYNDYVPVIHSSLVFPALLAAVYFIEFEEAASQFSDYDWFRILKKILEETKGNTTLEKIQIILDLPVNRTLLALTELFEE
jgi:hypothetical protein